ncbi:MAG: chitobiase/beta-hexosaminidase C-terminal domain-containing protein [Muribaculaceae bacterium]|nr:chitobiase/beta-hexosaminidase C-terminal domain-containing protein [Muribaculaceae bacterium]
MTFEHLYADWQTAVPEITADEENQIAVISCATEGAVIRYTLDGSEPTEESEAYTEPIEFYGKEMTIKARAFADGMYASEISELQVSGTTGVDMTDFYGVKVTKEAGNAVVYSDKALRIAVYTLDGHLVRILDVKAGRNVIDDLDSNVYIIGNVRIKL